MLVLLKIALALFAASVAVAGGVSAETPSLKTVLQRVERYVVAYESELSSLVARERYVQTVKAFRGEAEAARTLTSDFLFLRLPGVDGPWLGFRDVIEVNGHAVERHEERLREIVAGSADNASRAWAMSRESARYNIGRLERTVNVPVGVLGWMHPRLRERFEFRQSGEEDTAGVRAWRIAFKERRRPTIIRTPDHKNFESSGFIWVDPADGRLLQTQQENKRDGLQVTIRVEFAPNTAFGMLLPSRMTERYEDGVGSLQTEAVYTEYRRFGVTAKIK